MTKNTWKYFDRLYFSKKMTLYDQTNVAELEYTGCFTIVETKRLGTNPGF